MTRTQLVKRERRDVARKVSINPKANPDWYANGGAWLWKDCACWEWTETTPRKSPANGPLIVAKNNLESLLQRAERVRGWNADANPFAISIPSRGELFDEADRLRAENSPLSWACGRCAVVYLLYDFVIYAPDGKRYLQSDFPAHPRYDSCGFTIKHYLDTARKYRRLY